VQGAAFLVTALGLLCAGLVLSRGRDVRQALAVLLEFLLAAGLLRLVHGATYQSLATTALIVVIRKLVSFGFSAGPVRRGVGPTGRGSSPPATARPAAGRSRRR
jgi:Protein of unknown function (DUF1622)